MNPLVYDTTLRDGEQMPSVVFRPEEKLELARKFSEFGVSYIEVMPTVSQQEANVAKTLIKDKLDAELTAFTRMRKQDIDVAIDCGFSRIFLFTPVSDIQRTIKLGISREENERRAIEFIDYSKDHGLKVDFGGEDASRLYREDSNYLLHFIDNVKYGIDHFFPGDTLGMLFPDESYMSVKRIKDRCKCKVGLHHHNDMGLATANTVEGIRAGAEVFSGTFTGIGERAGNAPIEEVCVALKMRGYDLDVKCDRLYKMCRTVEEYSGARLQMHKPIVGDNAFCHESGIHVSAIIKDTRTYELFPPDMVGCERKIIFGKQSGKAGLKHVLDDYRLSEIER